MSRRMLVALLMASCRHREPAMQVDVDPKLGSVAVFRARADAFGCEPVESKAPPLGPSGAHAFTCTIVVGGCCKLRVEAATDESQGPTRLHRVSIYVDHCKPGEEYIELDGLLSPFIDRSEHATFSDFITRSWVPRTDDERKEWGVEQHLTFGHVHVGAFFEGDTEAPKRWFHVDTQPYPPDGGFLFRADPPVPCDDSQ